MQELLQQYQTKGSAPVTFEQIMTSQEGSRALQRDIEEWSELIIKNAEDKMGELMTD